MAPVPVQQRGVDFYGDEIHAVVVKENDQLGPTFHVRLSSSTSELSSPIASARAKDHVNFFI